MNEFRQAAFEAAARYVCDAEAIDTRERTVMRNGRWMQIRFREWAENVALKQLILSCFYLVPDDHGARALDRNKIAPSLKRRLTLDDLITVCGWTYEQSAH